MNQSNFFIQNFGVQADDHTSNFQYIMRAIDYSDNDIKLRKFYKISIITSWQIIQRTFSLVFITCYTMNFISLLKPANQYFEYGLVDHKILALVPEISKPIGMRIVSCIR